MADGLPVPARRLVAGAAGRVARLYEATDRPDEATAWQLRADSGRGLIDPAGAAIRGGATVDLEGRAVLLFSSEEP